MYTHISSERFSIIYTKVHVIVSGYQKGLYTRKHIMHVAATTSSMTIDKPLKLMLFLATVLTNKMVILTSSVGWFFVDNI